MSLDVKSGPTPNQFKFTTVRSDRPAGFILLLSHFKAYSLLLHGIGVVGTLSGGGGQKPTSEGFREIIKLVLPVVHAAGGAPTKLTWEASPDDLSHRGPRDAVPRAREEQIGPNRQINPLVRIRTGTSTVTTKMKDFVTNRRL